LLVNLQIEINDEDDPENFQGNYRPGMAGNTILRFSLDKRGKDLKINRKPSMLSLEELIKRRDRLANVKNITEAEKKQLLETQMQLHSNASMACSVIAFAAIGIPLAIRTARRETMANAALALGLALGYYVLSILLGLLKDHPSLRPDLLAWLPNLLFLSCGLLFLRKVR